MGSTLVTSTSSSSAASAPKNHGKKRNKDNKEKNKLLRICFNALFPQANVMF